MTSAQEHEWRNQAGLMPAHSARRWEPGERAGRARGRGGGATRGWRRPQRRPVLCSKFQCYFMVGLTPASAVLYAYIYAYTDARPAT